MKLVDALEVNFEGSGKNNMHQLGYKCLLVLIRNLNKIENSSTKMNFVLDSARTKHLRESGSNY